MAPDTLSVAVDVVLAAAPDAAASVAVPSEVLPFENVTVPDGAALPLAAVTVAVNCVLPAAKMLAGLATMVVVVAIGALVTVTAAEAVEAEKLPVGT